MRRGFYWVRVNDHPEPCIGYWTGERWLFIAPDCGYLAPQRKLEGTILREIEYGE